MLMNPALPLPWRGTELICKRVARRKNAFVSSLVLGVIAAHAIKQAVLDIAKTGNRTPII